MGRDHRPGRGRGALARADAGAEAEAEADRAALLEDKGDDANQARIRIDEVHRRGER